MRLKRGLNLKLNIKWLLVLYDFIAFSVVYGMLIFVYKSYLELGLLDIAVNFVLAFASILFCRFCGEVYRQVWRYGGVQCYIRLIASDFFATLIFISLEYFTEGIFHIYRLSFALMLALMSTNLIFNLTLRMIYRYCFKCGNEVTFKGRFFRFLLKLFANVEVRTNEDSHKIKVAIVGAGITGVNLAEELLDNVASAYTPRLFIDYDHSKAGREIRSIPVFNETDGIFEILREYKIQEIVIAVPTIDSDRKKELYDFYVKSGCKIKTYDYPLIRTAGSKKQLREFDIEDLLFRKQVQMSDDKTRDYYKNKVILITGGGGSIGSELCRQFAEMAPKQIIVLDIYENGVYDVQQELKFKYKDKLNIKVEIASITNMTAMEKIFECYRPDIVINAAAHKHVPLMEHNCVEAVENNVFGTLNVLKLCEKYKTQRFMMVSTDKAVNPTNVMGATKRMCEMIAQSFSSKGTVKCSCTRFGNVLGSAGSVIPLFKKQISAGGPVTLTDKRIIRYFMTIPEASQLVLQSGAMAKNGELFVLDMGQPVKIYDLAKNMIRFSGVDGVEIVETGLRPGEKLYEELLVDTENLDSTDNNLIFVERETPLSMDSVMDKLKILEEACATGDDDKVRAALHDVVPTFKDPDEVNKSAHNSMEMNIVRKY